MIKFGDYKNCLLKDKILLKSQQRFISKKRDVYTEDINKIALSNDDDKRIVSSDKINKYDINGFDINSIHKDAKTKYDSNGFDINGIHKDINISFGEDIDEKKMLKNTLWLKNRYNFLKSYIKLLGEKKYY